MNYRQFAYSIKLQIAISVIIGLIGGLTTCLLTNETIYEFNFDHEQFKDTILLLIQVNSLIVGLLCAFFFFKMQTIESQRLTYFLEYKKNVEQLVKYFVDIPSSAFHLNTHLAKILNVVEPKNDDDFPFGEEERTEFIEHARQIKDDKNLVDPTQNRYLIGLLGNIEFYSNKIGYIIVGTWLSSFLLNSIKKQVFLIILLILTSFWLSLRIELLNEVNIGIFLFLLIFSIFSLLELLAFIIDHYKNLNAEIEKNET